MLGKLKDLIMRHPVNTLPIVVFVLLLTAAINMYITKADSDSLEDFGTVIQEQHDEQEWNEISSIISLSQTAAKQNSKYLAQKIEVDLMRKYNNLDLLKVELANGTFSTEFYDVLKENLSQENGAPSSLFPLSYNTVVGLQDGVIALFSNESTTKIRNPKETSIVGWDSFIVKNPNPVLAQTAINSVLRRDSGFIFWQTENSEDGNLEKNPNMTMNTIKKAYQEYGMDGLKHFGMLSPAYITETGDIFNIDDKTFMQKNDNYKIIIIQSFNLYDIVNAHQSMILTHEKFALHNETFLTDFVKYKHIKAITWSFILFIISLALINIYNSERKQHVAEHQNIEGDIKKENNS